MRRGWLLLLLGLPLGVACSAPEDSARLVDDWRFAGHYALALDDNALVPVLIHGKETLRACVDPGREVDTSQWEGALEVGSVESLDEESRGRDLTFRPPERRAGSVACFTPASGAEIASGARLHACLSLRDRYSGAEQRLPCRTVLVLDDAEPLRTLNKELSTYLRSGAGSGWRDFIDGLDQIRDRASTAGFVGLAHRADLIAVYYLERDGGDEGVREARARLAAEPAWLGGHGAESLAGQTALQKARAFMTTERPRDARAEARRAADFYHSIADPLALSAVLLETGVLGRRGAYREATDRLHAELSDCEFAPCHESLMASARSSLSWWLAQHPDPPSAEVEFAIESLRSYLGTDLVGVDRVEVANATLNLALLEARLGQDPRLSLLKTQEVLAEWSGEKSEALKQWAELIEADWEVHDLPASAGARAEKTASVATSPEVAAWAWGTAGRAWRLDGQRERAAAAFERALVFHEHAVRGSVPESGPLSLGRRSEDFYRAARLQIELNRPEEAWEMLVRVDTLEGDHLVPLDCDPAGRSAREAWRRDLLAELVVLERPASSVRREQRRPMRRAVMEDLQEIVRLETQCRRSQRAGEPDYRAFAVADEIFLLERRANAVEVERRTELSQEQLAAVVRALRGADRDSLSDEEWIAAVFPVAQALIPQDPKALSEVTSFGLHGVLQEVPVAALPVAVPDRAHDVSWLADFTTVLHSAGSDGRPAPTESVIDEELLFVLDPLGDLEGAKRLAPIVGELFPSASLVVGDSASSGAVLDRLRSASWLHVGAHGAYDPAFPDLSSLRLADGDLLGVELANASDRLVGVNLSSCQSGRGEVTAGLGRYGLGGALSRLGVAWVVSSRSTLADDLAAAFNGSFYRALAGGETIPRAYSAALRDVRGSFPASLWSSFLLLGPSQSDFRGGK